jgi:cytochrome c-type biogenesis protein CcmE
MHPVRKQRLILVLFVVLFSSAAIGLVVYALRGNINLFFPPAEVAAGKAPVGQPIRAVWSSTAASSAAATAWRCALKLPTSRPACR